jgi:hypothetical protein
MANPPLPQAVILDIVHFCDIPTLKSLRLAQRLVHNLIDTYQMSIYSNASECSFEKEEIDSFQLLDGLQPAILRLFALEYRVRTAKWLAGVGMENLQEDEMLCHPGIQGNIGYSEVQGDSARGYVTIGLSIL